MSRICPKCGAENRDSAKFCLMCAHQLAQLKQATPRMVGAMVRRRNRYRRGLPLDAVSTPSNSGFAPSTPFTMHSSDTEGSPPPNAAGSAHHSLSAGWYTAIGLGVLLIMGSIAWAVAPHRPARSYDAPLAVAAASASAASAHPVQPPAQEPARSESLASEADTEQTPAQAQSHEQADAPSDEQADTSADAQAAPAEPAPRAQPARRPRPKPAPSPARKDGADRASARAAQPSSKSGHAAAAAVASEPQRMLCGGDSIAQTICLMRECDKPANARLPQCVQLQQRADALRNASGNRPYYGR